MDNRQLRFLCALSALPGIGQGRLRALLDTFETPEQAWTANTDEWRASGITGRSASTALTARDTANPDHLWEELLKHGIQAITEDSPYYPRLLRDIPEAPPLIYARGSTNWNDRPLIAVVGTRRPTAYGKQVTERMVSELSGVGFGIISGLAFGVDSLSHQAALEARAYTVAVLGNGLDDDRIAPHTHLPLARTILAEHGALLSEYPPGTSATPGTFPARNRIIAGMTLGTLVVEAAERSGSLITARFALEFGREVFAVPGSINSRLSDGPNALIRQGAKLVTGIGHILEELRPFIPATAPRTATDAPPATDLPPDEGIVMRFLESEPVHIDKLAKLTTLETTHLSAALTMLEIKGLAKNVGGMHYIKTIG